MSMTRSSESRYSLSLSSTIKIATRVLPVLALATIAFCLFAPPVHATATCGGNLSCGTLQINGNITASCSPGAGWYYYSNSQGTAYLNCKAATVTSCAGTDPNGLGLTFGYLDPSNVSGTGITQTKGVIVLHGGGGGTAPESFALADAYFKAGYEIVQLAWADDWEMTYDPFGTHAANVQNAACRPATFLYWVYTNLLPSSNTNPAVCALGTSAGSAAIAYSLAYYGASGWLDNVELLSGPVLSDIEQGCGVGNGLGGNVTVCDPNSKNGGWGCQLGTGGSTWTLSSSYVGGAQIGVRNWTNDPSCRAGQTTSTGSNTAWLNQSIVDQSIGQQGQGAVPVFNYSPTSMSAWLCRSVYNPNNWDCLANGNSNPNYCPNNSSPQGQIFYAQIPVNTANYAVYAVDSCINAEGVAGGNVPGYQASVFNGTVQGINAITYDMVGYTSGSITIRPQCVPRHNN